MPRSARGSADERKTDTYRVTSLDMSALPVAWTLAVVVRHTAYKDQGPMECTDLMRAYTDPADADQEAARLNAVARPHVTYFVKLLHQRAR